MIDNFFTKYADFSGRARRKEYWLFLLYYSIAIVVFGFIDGTTHNYIGDSKIGILSCILYFFMVIPAWAVCFRRLHDTGRSGWWILIGFIPIIGSIVLLIFLCTASDNGENKYGESPFASTVRPDRSRQDSVITTLPKPQQHTNILTKAPVRNEETDQPDFTDSQNLSSKYVSKNVSKNPLTHRGSSSEIGTLTNTQGSTPPITKLEIPMNEEELWAQALNEYESPSRRVGLWAKAFSEVDGNEPAAKAKYLKWRFDEILKEKQKEASDKKYIEKQAEAIDNKQEVAANIQSGVILKPEKPKNIQEVWDSLDVPSREIASKYLSKYASYLNHEDKHTFSKELNLSTNIWSASHQVLFTAVLLCIAYNVGIKKFQFTPPAMDEVTQLLKRVPPLNNVKLPNSITDISLSVLDKTRI